MSFAINGSYRRPDLVALLDARVDADPGRGAVAAPSVRPAAGTRAGPPRRGAPRRRVRAAPCAARGARPRAIRSCSPDEVDAGHELRHRMLDLDARVQLEEEELVAVEHEFRGARARRTRLRARTRQAASLICERSPGSSAADGDSSSTFWCRRCTEHSRSPSASDRAVPVREQLDLDVPRPLEVALEEHPRRRRRRPAPRAALPRPLRRAHPASRTTRMPRPPPPAAAFTSSGSRSPPALRSAATGTPASRARPLRRELVTAGTERRRRRADPVSPASIDGLGEAPRSRRGSRSPGCTASAPLSAAARTYSAASRYDAISTVSVGAAGVKRPSIVRRDDRDGLDSLCLAGPEDPQRDLAPVRYE